MKKFIFTLSAFLFIFPLFSQDISEEILEDESFSDDIVVSDDVVNEERSFKKNATEFGIYIGADLSESVMLKTYIAEDLNVMFRFTNGIALDGGVRIVENIIRNDPEPYVYIIPCLDFRYKHFYIGGGVLLPVGDSMEPSFFARIGGAFGDWNWGPGKGEMNIGVEVSPMLYWISTDDSIGSAFGSVFATIFNCVKIDVGVKWFLPI